jgi:hypothetical protein
MSLLTRDYPIHFDDLGGYKDAKEKLKCHIDANITKFNEYI